jgi:hypothetical protein
MIQTSEQHNSTVHRLKNIITTTATQAALREAIRGGLES